MKYCLCRNNSSIQVSTRVELTKMQNFWVRLNNVVFFAIGVLICMATMCSFSSLLHTGEPVLKTLKLNNLKSLKNHGGIDRALFTFDLSADLRPAFHWNIHQLFVFVVAEYKSEENELNQMIVWDRIITSVDKANLRETNEHIKYSLVDQGADLRGKTVTLRLLWDHMPITGRLYTSNKGNSSFTFPNKYKSA